MNEYLALKFFHLLLFVYWLGGDLGTFYGSRFVVDAKLSPAARATAARIMIGVDMAPRICMPLILPFGVQMAAMQGWLLVPGIVVVAIWLLCAGWLAMVLLVHHYSGQPFGQTIGRIDFWFRVAMIAGLVGVAIYGLATGRIVTAPWVAVKLLIFAACVVCGLVIRVKLKPFGPAFGKLMARGPDDETNRVIADSIAGCKPLVVMIWVGLLASAALGMHLI